MKSRIADQPLDDPYVPGHGDLSFDVEHYRLELEYSVDTNQLGGRATLTAIAVDDLDRFELDLHHLRVSKITIDGAAPAKYSHHRDRLVVRPRSTIAAGQTFTIVVVRVRSEERRVGKECR